MTNWYLVRHGETAWTAEGRLQGHIDIGLTDAGRAQCARLGRRLATVEFAAAYSSDLSRTAETTRILLGERTLQPEFRQDLREILHGAWQGLTYAEAERQNPEEYRRFMAGDPDAAPPGAESLAQVLLRFEGVRDYLMANASTGNILVVSHGGALRALLLALLHLSHQSYWAFRVFPASLSIVEVEGGTVTVQRWNDTAHLEGDGAA